jgi:hypothetical protein
MDTIEIYKTLKKDDLLILVHDKWSLWTEALLHELEHGSDAVVAEMYESQASILLCDKKQLLDKLIKMDTYIDKLNKYKKDHGQKDSTFS